MKHFIFDVDGTLTPSRGVMDTSFKQYFIRFSAVNGNKTYLITGSDREKTLEQVGEEVYNSATRVYQCAGNDIWQQDVNIYTIGLGLPDFIKEECQYWLEKSKFPLRTGNHIEYRPGLVNFSIVGRNCTREQRAQYVEWDTKTGERHSIVSSLKGASKDDEFEFTVAGETGIDITKRGKGKEQILTDFASAIRQSDRIFFFGDKMMTGGNDHQLAYRLLQLGHTPIAVTNWIETMSVMNALSN